MLPETGERCAAVTGAEGESKVVLLVRLLNAIDQGRHAFEGLKDRVGESGRRPSTRSLRRYLAILSNAGFPLYFDRAANAYRFADGYSLKRLDLSSGELFGLVALRSLGASIGGTIGASIDEVAEKLTDSAGARARVEARSPVAFRLSEIRLDERGERAFALLSAAERSSRSVRFSYLDKEGRATTRTVDPYGFVINAGRVYCVAYDHTRRDMRTFAVDNVGDPDVLASTFARPEGFNIEAYAAASISGVLHAGETSKVRVHFAPRVAKAAAAARVVSEREVTERNDGGVEIVYHVSDVDELVRWVLGWGSQAEILAPPAARERIAELASAISGKYGEYVANAPHKLRNPPRRLP
jgi:predicted DNA-binding transcriptional regulator YafY